MATMCIVEELKMSENNKILNMDDYLWDRLDKELNKIEEMIEYAKSTGDTAALAEIGRFMGPIGKSLGITEIQVDKSPKK